MLQGLAVCIVSSRVLRWELVFWFGGFSGYSEDQGTDRASVAISKVTMTVTAVYIPYMHMYIYIYIHVSIQIYTSVLVHTHTCIFIIYICAHMYVCMYVRMYVCMCVCVCYSVHVTYIPGPCYDSSTILPITLVHKGQVCICSNANRQSVIIELQY